MRQGTRMSENSREQSFLIVTEPWSEYVLEDGVKVKIRSTAVRVRRALDEEGKPAFNSNGDPLVAIDSQLQICATRCPAEERSTPVSEVSNRIN